MFIYFADWTNKKRLDDLASKRVPLGGKIIKGYASPVEPGILIGRPLTTLDISDDEFDRRETFNYGSRFKLTGDDLEKHMEKCGLSEEGKKYLRAIFRFGNLEPLSVIHFAMQISAGGRWYFAHPLDPVHGPIHGIDEAVARPHTRNAGIHIDIFTDRTLSLLAKFVDFYNPNQILNERETVCVMREIRLLSEGNFTDKERK